MSRERIAKLAELAERGELTFRELLEVLGEPLSTLPREGDLTLRELCEALGKPLSKVPKEQWDDKVPASLGKVVMGPVKRIELQRVKTLSGLAQRN